MTTRTAAALSAAVAIAVYWPALQSQFVGDDFMILHRLRGLASPGDVLRFFRGEFFEYYRPIGFVAHAVDWSIAGADARQFHLTNVLLHAASTVGVLLIGRALSPRTMAGPAAALLFALHASNHEAVVWISARFDLLATCFSLAALYWMVRGGTGSTLGAPLLFLGALLSKESAVALPIAAAGFSVFALRAAPADALRRVAPWMGALALYAVLRHVGGGVSAVGGASRLPKLIAFLLILALVLWLSGSRWLRLRDWLRGHRGAGLGATLAVVAAAAVAAAAGGATGAVATEKLAVAGFALFNLVSPVLDVSAVPFYLDVDAARYWLGGAIGIAFAALALAAAWRRLVDDGRMWFLGAFLVAALLPISALTEGARYLYLPSAALSLLAGIAVEELAGRHRAIARSVVAAVLALSVAQIEIKLRDWRWAGQLTADGARLADAALAPSCGEGHVVFLTEPVALRGVYTHFLYETFEIPRGCMPSTFQVLARMVRIDTPIEVTWDGPSRIVITVPEYRNNFVLSEDLRHFDRPLREAPTRIVTPLGLLTAERVGRDERLTLTLSPGNARTSGTRFFYFNDGAMRGLE
ncbi:MAG: hypothetical protein ABIQ52_20345 [Vicinamibacterales bacterium]